VVNKTANNNTPDENDVLIYTVTAHNNGPDGATGVVQRYLPVSVTLASNPSQGSYDSATGLGRLGRWRQETVTLTLRQSSTRVRWGRESPIPPGQRR
jgi:uncharacterized repeat protein (TIGR01451 family)